MGNFREKWELIKLEIRNVTLKFAARRQKSNRNKLEVLEKKIQTLEAELLQECPLFSDTETQLMRVKSEYNELIKQKTLGAIIRSRAAWAEGGELPTKYFLNLEKSNANRKSICRLIDDSGRELLNAHEILGEITEFYANLYRSKNKRDISYVKKLNIPKISIEQREELDKIPEQIEISKALNDLKNSKAPGIDGLLADFYKIFWNKLKASYT